METTSKLLIWAAVLLVLYIVPMIVCWILAYQITRNVVHTQKERMKGAGWLLLASVIPVVNFALSLMIAIAARKWQN